MGNSKNDVVKTLLYFDIFKYPLKRNELWYYFHGKNIRKDVWEKGLKDKRIATIESFYFIKGSSLYVKERKLRERLSEKKTK